MDFSYSVSSLDNENVLTMKGRLDTLAAGSLDQDVQDALSSASKKLILAINDLVYISSSGLRCFVWLLKNCKKNGVQLSIVGMCPTIREVFDRTGLDQMFNIQ